MISKHWQYTLYIIQAFSRLGPLAGFFFLCYFLPESIFFKIYWQIFLPGFGGMLLYFLRFFHSKDIAGQLTSWPTEAPLVRCPTSLICCAFIFVIFLLGEMSEQLISRLFRPLPNLLLAQASPINCLRVPRKGECTSTSTKQCPSGNQCPRRTNVLKVMMSYRELMS